MLLFQSLIGRLATCYPVSAQPVALEFQSLIGRLATLAHHASCAIPQKFQSLIGRLATRQKLPRPSPPSLDFNPS